MGDYSLFIENMIWSFSRLNSFDNCPYAWKLTYIDCLKGENGFFSEYGTHMHQILEKFAKGELEIYELVDEYETNYNTVVEHNAPPNAYVDLGQKYYDLGRQYLENFDGFGDYEIIEVEKRIDFSFDDIRVTGFIDLLLRDRTDQKFIIADHKSSAVKSKTSDKAKEYLKQMTLYAIGIYEELGEYPKELHINAFREGKYYKFKFDENKVDEVKQWVKNTVDKIKIEENYLPKSDKFFCNFLCGFRGSCEFKPQE